MARITTTKTIATTIMLTFPLSLAVTLGGLGGEDVLDNDGVREGELGGGVVEAAIGGGIRVYHLAVCKIDEDLPIVKLIMGAALVEAARV